MALLILWAPVWFKSSRLSQRLKPSCLDKLGQRYRGEGRPT